MAAIFLSLGPCSPECGLACDQQQQPHLGNLKKYRFSGPTPDLWNQNQHFNKSFRCFVHAFKCATHVYTPRWHKCCWSRSHALGSTSKGYKLVITICPLLTIVALTGSVLY